MILRAPGLNVLSELVMPIVTTFLMRRTGVKKDHKLRAAIGDRQRAHLLIHLSSQTPDARSASGCPLKSGCQAETQVSVSRCLGGSVEV